MTEKLEEIRDMREKLEEILHLKGNWAEDSSWP